MDQQKRKLGKSEIEITPIGLGAWQFSESSAFTGFFWDPLSKEITNDIVKIAVDLGINWFDTAEAYGFGRSEQGLAKGLEDIGMEDNDVTIATKWFPLFRFARNIRKTIDTRLEKLEPYSIDLYQIHQPWSFSSVTSQMEAMADIADLNKIQTIGISNFSAKSMRKAFEVLDKRSHPLVSNQIRYSLLDRQMESNGILETAEELDITIIAHSPLKQGLLTGKFHEDKDLLRSRPFVRRRLLSKNIEKSRELVGLLQTIAEEVQATPAQVALNWVISFHGQRVVAIPGASKPQHIEQNAKAMHVDLSQEQMNALDEKSQQFQ